MVKAICTKLFALFSCFAVCSGLCLSTNFVSPKIFPLRSSHNRNSLRLLVFAKHSGDHKQLEPSPAPTPSALHTAITAGAIASTWAALPSIAAAAAAQVATELPNAATAAATAAAAVAAAGGKVAFEPRGVTVEDSAVFVIGVIPFVWASIEFWRRIAAGEPFGTTKNGGVTVGWGGQDGSVVIDTGRADWAAEDGKDPRRGARRILSPAAILIAYVLMGLAGFSFLLVVVAGLQLPTGK